MQEERFLIMKTNEELHKEIEALKDKNVNLENAINLLAEYVGNLVKDDTKRHYPSEYYSDIAAEIRHEIFNLLIEEAKEV